MIREIRATYRETAEVLGKLGITFDQMSREDAKKISELYERIANNTDWQAIYALGSAVAGGGLGIAASVTEIEALGALGKAAPQVGEMAQAFSRGESTRAEGDKELARHNQSHTDSMSRSSSEALRQVMDAANQLFQTHRSLLTIAR